MKAAFITRSLWTQRRFLWLAARRFRLQPLLAHLTRQFITRSPFDLPPVVILQLTEACNLRCKMCYEWGLTGSQHREEQKKPATLPLDIAIALLEECGKNQTFYSLFGGEPLLYPGLDRILEKARERGSSMETVTNGTMLSKKAQLLVELGMDLIRISLDGPREINDEQRGSGSYDKVMEGLESVYRQKQRLRKASPLVGIICTVTRDNSQHLERLFCRDLDLRWVDLVTIQMQSFVTQEMGLAYDQVLRGKLGQLGKGFWRGMLRDPEEFSGLDLAEMLRQHANVRSALVQRGIPILLFPNTWTAANLGMYLAARWREMKDYRRHCIAPWVVTDVTATGDVAPCHIFYDLTVGNLKNQSMGEIWNGEPFNRFRGFMRQGLLPICPACCQYYGYP